MAEAEKNYKGKTSRVCTKFAAKWILSAEELEETEQKARS